MVVIVLFITAYSIGGIIVPALFFILNLRIKPNVVDSDVVANYTPVKPDEDLV